MLSSGVSPRVTIASLAPLFRATRGMLAAGCTVRVEPMASIRSQPESIASARASSPPLRLWPNITVAGFTRLPHSGQTGMSAAVSFRGGDASGEPVPDWPPASARPSPSTPAPAVSLDPVRGAPGASTPSFSASGSRNSRASQRLPHPVHSISRLVPWRLTMNSGETPLFSWSPSMFWVMTPCRRPRSASVRTRVWAGPGEASRIAGHTEALCVQYSMRLASEERNCS